MDIREVGENFGDFMKSNGGKIAIAVGGGIVLFVLISQISGDEVNLITPTGYTSYPDADKNANVIIDQVNQHTTYENTLTRDDIADLGDYVSGRFDSTDGYIKDGFENMNENLNQWGEDILDSNNYWGNTIIDRTEEMEGNIIANQDKWGGTIMGGIGDLQSGIEGIQNSVNSNNNILHDMNHSLGDINDRLNQSAVSKPSKNNSNEYYKKFQYGGNWDSNSIVDGFKSIGIFTNNGARIDTVASRKDIAEANGITNYTGTQAQNDKLVALGKAGKLKKPKK